MNLWSLPKKQTFLIDRIHDALPQEAQLRLHDLGFTAGQHVECLHEAPLGGPKVFRIGDAVFSLARDLASAVEVRIS